MCWSEASPCGMTRSTSALFCPPWQTRFNVSGDNYWVIDTDYDNYAITYACRSLKEDGSCDDGYSLIFSRNPRGLPPAIQRIVRQKQEEICMSGQFQPVLQSGTLG